MEQEQTTLPGVQILIPRRIEDARGFFSETWNKETLLGLGIDVDFVQDNHSLSREAGVVRGLHFQAPPHAQDKLVRVGAGAILDVAVDIRTGSPQFGKWTAIKISARNGRQVFIPKGFLHGFVTLEPNTEILYKTSDVYAPDCDGSVYFADPDLGIDWGLCADRAILSDKDRNAQRFADFKSPFTFEG
ncbi:dTDP-4-dehydrorhamnose 3,5-epimerase [Roseovarius gaetbuli]|uniref:dTDP-4-dehydrorhamnose 3,5-epimerase n=1 Tax=Roseovarius gaetbuli TaxID=1356575 RepID=A0A1X7A4N5_9RHOB|nr:dTDP-4-dehydrorhamnose 3,5-epimerase [Roseovarius gaetbuli]SLN70011.1 dTDP-4-dehydrorhamnose 3,5-epimerase [Roseovarius gaetbuli]